MKMLFDHGDYSSRLMISKVLLGSEISWNMFFLLKPASKDIETHHLCFFFLIGPLVLDRRAGLRSFLRRTRMKRTRMKRNCDLAPLCKCQKRAWVLGHVLFCFLAFLEGLFGECLLIYSRAPGFLSKSQG